MGCLIFQNFEMEVRNKEKKSIFAASKKDSLSKTQKNKVLLNAICK